MLSVCHKCDQKYWAGNHVLGCRLDGHNIVEHAETLGCPKGYFDGRPMEPRKPTEPPIPLAGDLVASVTAKFGIDRAAKFLAKLAGKPDCGCAERRKWLNRLDARVRRALGI